MKNSTVVQSTPVKRNRKRILSAHATETKPPCANRERSVPDLVSYMPELVPNADSIASHVAASVPALDSGRHGSVPGVRGEARGTSEGRKPLCGDAAAEPLPEFSPVVDDSGSSLDKLHITQDASCPETRRRWLQQVERETDPHRVAKAKHHWRRASQIRQERQKEQRPLNEVVQGIRWHHRRAWGQIERFQRVYDCGTAKYWLVCTQCTASKERTASCRIPLLCLSCRGRITRERRAEFYLARNRALDRARVRDLFEHSRPGGRWTEKLLTLTAPHFAEHGVAKRIELLFAAWPLLRDSIKKHLAQRAAPHEHLVAWFRSFEWEPGHDALGHPHFHFWWLSPYIKQELIRRWWRAALKTVGYPRHSLSRVIIDIQEVRYGKGAALEVVKYLTKDILPDRELVGGELFSRVYESLDGRRLTQASARFFKGIEREAKCKCGARGCFRRSTKPPEGSREKAPNA